ncbi:J domain-containing protein [Kinneretia asaccharophila]|uniref:J domain-containing protein n=1 Tax=Roseateles asaccharophilus TaxID=582607 RepID=A0A4R6N8R1_9BURK|nr:J domain-containing protein [Roseateles asaccharophilus]MDN3545207.1 J domain-containing protein [Roseateles asaccharophilus]TDP11406.1 hypothetical protein DFR39_103333 [Roseateles asaccharophilus]
MRLLLPDYFAALELTPQADEAEVKRAYAQRLKQINRQADPQRFQELRAHYEAALAHVREGRGFVMVDEAPEPLAEAQQAPVAPVAPGGDAPPAEPAPAPEILLSPLSPLSPREQAQQVFDAMAAEFCHLSLLELPPAKSVLSKWLRSPELVSLEAGEHFRGLLQEAICERRLGRHTALLLFAAMEVLGWQDAQTLVQPDSAAYWRLQTVLDGALSLSYEHQRLWRWLAQAPNGDVLSYMPAVEQDFDWDNPVQQLCCEPGELEAWQRLGSAHTPLDVLPSSRPRPQLGFLEKLNFHRSLWLCMSLMMLCIWGGDSLVRGYAARKNSVGEQQACTATMARAATARWRNISAAEIGRLEQCAVKSPPERCEDRERLRTLSALGRALSGGDEHYVRRPAEVIFNTTQGLLYEVKGGCPSLAAEALRQDWWLKMDHLPSARHLVKQVANCASDGFFESRDSWEHDYLALRLLQLTDAWQSVQPRSGGQAKSSSEAPVLKLEQLLSRSPLLETAPTLEGEARWPACR